MRLILFAFMTALGFGQVTGISPTAITRNHTINGPLDWGFPISILGTGPWSGVGGGDSNCFNYYLDKSSGTAPDTIYLLHIIGTTDPGGSCHVRVAGQNLTITYTDTPSHHSVFVSNQLHVADSGTGCTLSSNYYYGTNCIVPNPSPGGTWTMPTNGTSYTDPLFGGIFQRIAPAWHTTLYPSRPAFNLTNAYVIVAGEGSLGPSGNGIFDLSGNKIYNDPAVPDLGGCHWSNLQASVLFCENDATGVITKAHLGTPPNVVSDGAIYSYGAPFGSGGTGTLSKDDWIQFFATDLTQLCALDLWNPSHVICAPMSIFTPTLTDVDYSELSVGKDPAGYRYIVVASRTPSLMLLARFKDTDTSISLASNGNSNPEAPAGSVPGATWSSVCGSAMGQNSSCLGDYHSDTVEINGEQYWVWSGSLQIPYVPLSSSLRMSALSQGATSIQLGGGYDLTWAGHETEYDGCSRLVPICLIMNSPPQKVSFRISGVSGSSPFTATTVGSHPYNPGDNILIGSVEGCAGPNGTFNVATVPTSNTFTIAQAVTGSCTINTGDVTTNIQGPGDDQNQIIAAVRMDNGHVRLLGHTYAVAYTDTWQGAAGYFDFLRGSMSPDGRYGVVNENGGIPDNVSPYVIATGFDLFQGIQPWQFNSKGDGVYVTPTDTQLFVTASIPMLNSCTVSVSTSATLSSPLTLTLTGGRQRSGILGSLTAGTVYYWGANCGDYEYASGSFTTLPAAMGTRTIAVSGYAPVGTSKIQVNYGTTSALGSSTSAASCSAGSTCRQSLTSISPGALYSQVVWLDGSSVQIGAMPIQTQAIQ